MSRKARWEALAVLLTAAVALGAYWYSGYRHPPDRRFPIQGIDVSHHQGGIDWAKLPAQGVDFAYIKSSEPWHLWQVSNFRRLRGIEGRVDWNVRRP